MRHIEWKRLQDDPVVIRAQEALRMAQVELSQDPFWRDKVGHLSIFPAFDRTRMLRLQVKDLAFGPMGQPPMTRRDIAWDTVAKANSEEAMAIVIAEIYKFDPEYGIGRS